MKKLKVLHLIDHMGFGGAQRLVSDIIDHDDKIVHHELVSLRHSTNEITPKSKKQFHQFSTWTAFIKTKQLIQNRQFETLHCHLFKSYIFGYFLKLIFFPKIKLIFHFHSSRFLTTWWQKKFIQLSNKKVNLYITVSKAIKKDFENLGFENNENIIVLHNFINPPASIKPKRLTKNTQKITLGYVGRLSKVKGCDVLIKALPKLDMDFQLLIAGDGDQKEELVFLVKELKLGNKVKLLGFQKDVHSVYEKIDILIIPSLSESFGLTAIEAQSIGVPVIASNIEGLSEILTDRYNALLFRVGDSIDLANKINILSAESNTFNKLAINGIKNSHKYSINNYYKKLKVIYT